MLKLSTRQRAVLVDKLPDVANLGVGALVFGQSLGDHAFSLRLALIGVGIWAAMMGLTVALADEEDA